MSGIHLFLHPQKASYKEIANENPTSIPGLPL